MGNKVCVFGAGGQLGSDLLLRSELFSIEVHGYDAGSCDITDENQVERVVSGFRFDAIVNSAAYTQVDRAEHDRENAWRVNTLGAENIARACEKMGIPLIHVSTDYVFDGTAGNPYGEGAAVCPESVYGSTKAEGESKVLEVCRVASVVRTSWLFGENGPNFVKTMVRLAREREELKVVNDQRGCPTWSRDLADALLSMVKTMLGGGPIPKGVYHYCGMPEASWYELARYSIDEASKFQKLTIHNLMPIPTKEYPTPAKRPLYSVLSCDRIVEEFGVEQGDWRRGVREVIKSGA